MTIKLSPNGWNKVKLDDVAVRVMERHEASPDLPEPWVGAHHLDEGDLRIRRWSMSDDPVFPPTFKFKYPVGAVLIHSRNPKKVAIAEFQAITGEKIFALAPRDSSILSSRFLAFVLQTPGFDDFSSEWMKGSVNKFMNWSALARFEFLLPPLDQQLQIANTMAAVDDCLESVSTSITELGKFNKAWASEIFSFSGEAIEEKELSQVAEVTMGRQLSPSKRLGVRPLRYLRAANISPAGIDTTDLLEMDFTEEEEESYKARIDDVLLVEGGNEKSVGCPALISNSSQEFCIQNTLIRCRTKDPEILAPDFMYQVLRFHFNEGTFAKMCAGTTIMHLGQKRLAKLRVSIPALDHQIWITKRLNQFDKTNELLVAQSRHLQRVRRALLQSLVQGSPSNVQ